MEACSLRVKLDNIVKVDDKIDHSSFSGRVCESLESWNDKYVVGITGTDAKLEDGDILKFQSSYQVTVLSTSVLDTIDTHKLVQNLKPLCSALICDYMFIKSNESELAIILSSSWESSLSYVQWLLLKNVQVVVYIPETNDDENIIISRWNRHPFFKVQAFKSKSNRVMLRCINIKNLSSDVLNITKMYGASSIIVLSGAVEAFNVEQVVFYREVLLSAGICCRIVWCSVLEQIDPCECSCLFNKSISLNFFNFDAMLKSQSYVGVLQHSIIETVNNVINGNIFLS